MCGPGWDHSGTGEQLLERSAAVVGDVAGWRDTERSRGCDSEEEQGSVLAAILRDSGSEEGAVELGAGSDAELERGGLTATPAPELDALADRMSNLCVVGGEGTFFSLSVGGEGRLSEVLRPNH